MQGAVELTVANVLAALPKSAHPTAKRMLAGIRDAGDRDHAARVAHAFAHEFGAKWSKAVAKIVDDLDVLLAFFDFPAEHWIHLKSTNPIESTFATVRLRTRVTRGAGSRAAGGRWRSSSSSRPNNGGARSTGRTRRAGPGGAVLEKGVLIERSNQHDQEAAA